jgi:hypothetical protein
MLANGTGPNFGAPLNGATGNNCVRVTGTYDCASAPTPFDVSSTGFGAGKYVLLAANGLANYAGVTVSPPAGTKLLAVSIEPVNVAGVSYSACIVVTFIPV